MTLVLEIFGLVLISTLTIGMLVGWIFRGKTIALPLVKKLRLKFTIGPIEEKTAKDYQYLFEKKRRK